MDTADAPEPTDPHADQLARAFARRGDQLSEVRLALVDALQDAHTEIDNLQVRAERAESHAADLHAALIEAHRQNEMLEARIAATLSSRVAAKVRSLRGEK